MDSAHTTRPAPDTPGPPVYTVSQLNREIRTLLEASYPLIWVEGEISNLARPASGHLYFSLKDSGAQVRCAFFRPRQRLAACAPREGLMVRVRARVSLYEGRGDFQLIVEAMEEAGEGALRLALEALKRRLSAEGLFDSARKRPLPTLPRRIGLITSPSGAVLHDILTTLRRRFPAIPVLLYPVPVQGEGATEQIARALGVASARGDCDALILARGGGSLEDLWPFNEEQVVRAIHDCAIPVVCGVGHETDTTLADWAADARAPTPTAAAELLSPHGEKWLALFREYEARLARQARTRLRHLQQRLDWVSRRLAGPRERIESVRLRLAALNGRLHAARSTALAERRARIQELHGRLRQCSPQARIRQQALRWRHADQRLKHAFGHRLRQLQERVRHTAARLNALSPLSTLERGYAIVFKADSGAVIRSAGEVAVGERIRARLARGELLCRIEDRELGKK